MEEVTWIASLMISVCALAVQVAVKMLYDKDQLDNDNVILPMPAVVATPKILLLLLMLLYMMFKLEVVRAIVLLKYSPEAVLILLVLLCVVLFPWPCEPTKWSWGRGSRFVSIIPLDQEPPAKEELPSPRRQYRVRVDVHVFVAIKEKRKEPKNNEKNIIKHR